MASTKQHYNNHLAEHYAWMLGDIKPKQLAFKEILLKNGVNVKKGSKAIDLGAGNGLHSIALAELGYEVIAIDFCKILLDEIEKHNSNLSIQMICDDILNVARYTTEPVDLIVCAGDTLTHLHDLKTIQQLIDTIAILLKSNGNIYFSFRDYTTPLFGTDRFIPVKSDKDKIMTCFLEYNDTKLDVTDIIHFYKDNTWHTSLSTYTKLRLSSVDVLHYLEKSGMTITKFTKTNNLIEIVGKLQD